MAIANLNDMQTLATDTVFGNRVQMSLTIYCIVTISSEVTSSTLPRSVDTARKNYAAQVLNNPTFYKPLFVLACASNQFVANDATASGTIVGQQGATLASSALLCTDNDINNAVSAAFNAFVSGI
jgi:hypothetical protein